MIQRVSSPLSAYSAPPGTPLKTIQVQAGPAGPEPLDQAELGEVPGEDRSRFRAAFLASVSVLGLAGALAPTPASAAPAAAVVRTMEGTETAAPASSKRQRRDTGETHPFWRAVDSLEDSLRSAGRSLKEGVDGARQVVRENTPEPVQEGARQVEEGARKLNDLKWKGVVGNYDYSLDLVNADVDVVPIARLRGHSVELGARLKGEADLLRSELSRTEKTESGWETRHGLRGTLHMEGSVGASGMVGRAGAEAKGDYNNSSIQVRAEAFKEWRGIVRDDYKVSFEAATGLSHDVLNNDPGVHARFRQTLEGGNFRVADRDFKWVADARQEFRHSFSTGHTAYDVRVFGGVGHTFEHQVLGRNVTFETRLGPEIRITDQQGAKVSPRLSVKVHY